MSLVLITAIVLLVIGNIIAAVNCLRNNSLPDPLFLVVDAAAILYIMEGVSL